MEQKEMQAKCGEFVKEFIDYFYKGGEKADPKSVIFPSVSVWKCGCGNKNGKIELDFNFEK